MLKTNANNFILQEPFPENPLRIMQFQNDEVLKLRNRND